MRRDSSFRPRASGCWLLGLKNGTPFPKFFSQISTRFHFPLNATVAAFVFSCLYGLLYLASTTAFNSIINSAVLFLNITYTVPQGVLLVRGRSLLPQRYLSLGIIGYICNIFSVLWTVLLGVLVCMPPNLPIALGSMNYICVILVGVFIVINCLWFAIGRKSFEGPCIDWGMMRTGWRVNEVWSGRLFPSSSVQACV